MKPYRPRPDREERLASAVKAAGALVGLDLYPRHKRELLSICVWKVTELDGKWNTRFCSRGALEAEEGVNAEHPIVNVECGGARVAKSSCFLFTGGDERTESWSFRLRGGC
ncbi:MAG: hypothetical protein P1U90_11520 [Akkermansiaceae bacterium]|nr:hypothetical protein [Akkermansiaceae bacterium]